MGKEYMKLTLLNSFTTMSGNRGKFGKTTYPEVKRDTILGSTVLKLKTGYAYMFQEDVIEDVWYSAPTWLVPTGMAFQFERGYRRTWYGKYVKESPNKDTK